MGTIGTPIVQSFVASGALSRCARHHRSASAEPYRTPTPWWWVDRPTFTDQNKFVATDKASVNTRSPNGIGHRHTHVARYFATAACRAFQSNFRASVSPSSSSIPLNDRLNTALSPIATSTAPDLSLIVKVLA